MRRLPVFLILALMLLSLFAAPVRALDPGGGVSPVLERYPGVTRGATMVYDEWNGGLHFLDTIRVLNTTGTFVYFNFTVTTDKGTSTTTTLWTNVNAQVSSATNAQTGSLAFDYSKVGVMYYFIGSGLTGGSDYLGSPEVITASIFGHITFGDWRATNYYDNSVPKYGWIDHIEWDRDTGILLSYQVTYQGSGQIILLKSTNLWSSNTFWVGIKIIEDALSLVFPYLMYALILYVFSFLVIAIHDWIHVRGRKKSKGGKAPSPMWGQIKILLIVMLIVLAILYGGLYLLSLAIQYFSK